MRTANVSIYLLFALSLLGCDQSAPQGEGQPKQAAAPTPALQLAVTTVPVDLSTPDKALRSYWAVRDEIKRAQFATDLAIRARLRDDIQLAERQLPEVVTPALVGDFQTSFERPPMQTFSRDIMEVKVESESRAVISVVIKNTTPIPEGANVSESARESRRNGDKYRYVLEKSETGWRVAEIWSIDRYTGLTKYHPRDRRPDAPDFTFQAM